MNMQHAHADDTEREGLQNTAYGDLLNTSGATGATESGRGGRGGQKTSFSQLIPLFLEGGCSMMYLAIL